MMKFVLGVAVGAAGMWAYRSGKLESIMGVAPEPVRQAWQPAVDRVSDMMNSGQVGQVAAKVQDTVQQAQAPQIATPSPSEVAGRPSEPLPSSGA